MTRSILDTVLREMRAYGAAWRIDWSHFDGRTLRDQLDDLAAWAEKAQGEAEAFERGYTEGSAFLKDTEDRL